MVYRLRALSINENRIRGADNGSRREILSASAGILNVFRRILTRSTFVPTSRGLFKIVRKKMCVGTKEIIERPVVENKFREEKFVRVWNFFRFEAKSNVSLKKYISSFSPWQCSFLKDILPMHDTYLFC